MVNLAIFASGSGSNAQNIIEHFNGGTVAAVKIVICNKPNAYVLERAARLGIPSTVMAKEELAGPDPERLISLLQENSIGLVILAGYLLKIPQALTEMYRGRIINIHPALLPKFGGKGMYGMNVHKAVVEAGEKVSGITIHLVDEKYDNGTILFQAECPVAPEDTPEDVATKIHLLEQEHFPAVIERYISRQI